MKCDSCKETKKREMYNDYICIACRRKWEKEFYDRLKEKTNKK